MSTIDGERSPKRQRLESYSPASPPLNPDTKAFTGPNTPPPSVRMSPSWQTQSTQNQSHQGTTGTFPTPPSTSSFHGHAAARSTSSETGGDSGRQTPMAEADSEAQKDSEGDSEMKDGKGGGDEGDISMDDPEHRSTNHERKGAIHEALSAASSARPLFKLSTTPVEPCRPHPSQDLIQLYDLQRIQASVARRDPVTGEKINKLRKSYENKVKALGLDGRNKATQNQNELGGLLDPGWDMEHEPGVKFWDMRVRDGNQQLGNKDVEDDVFSKLSSALEMLPGRLPPKEHKEWQNMLGLDVDPLAAAKLAPNKLGEGTPSAIAKAAPASQVRSSAPASPGTMAGRPERSGKKRRYDDSSYVGYQEGYDDDGYTTGGSNAKRQKRKDFPSTSAAASQSARNSPSTFASGTQNGGIVGVRSS